MTSSAAWFRHPNDVMFTVVLTDDETASDGEDTTLYDRGNTVTAAERAWSGMPDNDGYGRLAAGQRLREPNSPSIHHYQDHAQPVASPNDPGAFQPVTPNSSSSVKSGSESIDRRRCRCSTNTVSAFVVLFLSVASFPVQFPDGAFPTLRSAADTQLRAALISALVGAILSALCLDYCDAVDREPRRRHVFYRRTLVTGSLCVAVFAFFRCIPGVPTFVLVATGFAAGVGLTTVVRLTSAILVQPTSEYDNVAISGSRWTRDSSSSLSWSSSEAARRCLMNGIVAAASLGAPLVSAGIASALLGPTTPITLDGIVSAARLHFESPHSDRVVDNQTYPFGSVANVSNGVFDSDSALNISSNAFPVVPIISDASSHTLGEFTSINTFESTNTTWVKWAPYHVITSVRLLFVVVCLFVCSLGAFILALLAVTETSVSPAVEHGKRNRSLLRGATVDDAAYDTGSDRSDGWRERLVRQLRAYGRREVALLLVVAFFVGSEQMLAYFVFVRAFNPVEAGTRTMLLGGICMAATSLLISAPVGFALRYLGRVKIQLPVAIFMPVCLTVLLIDAPWSRQAWAFYTIAGLWAVCDSCLYVTLTAFIDHLASASSDSPPVDGALSASRSLGHLIVFILFSYGNSSDDTAYSTWNASKVCVICVLVIFITSSVCYLAAEISFRLREPMTMALTHRRSSSVEQASTRNSQTDNEFISVSPIASSSSLSSNVNAPRDSLNTAQRYAAIVKYPDVENAANSWLPHINPVVSPKKELVKPLFIGD